MLIKLCQLLCSISYQDLVTSMKNISARVHNVLLLRTENDRVA